MQRSEAFKVYKDLKEKEGTLWYFLAGAAMANSTFREELFKLVEPFECPDERLAGLLGAVAGNDESRTAECLEAYGVTKGDKPVIRAILAKVGEMMTDRKTSQSHQLISMPLLGETPEEYVRRLDREVEKVRLAIQMGNHMGRACGRPEPSPPGEDVDGWEVPSDEEGDSV